MTAPEMTFATTGSGGVKQAAALLVEAARRGDVQVRHDRRWDVYLINGIERPEVRPMLAGLIDNGTLEVQDPTAVLSLIVPAASR